MGVTPFEFFRDVSHRRTRFPGGTVSAILSSAILVEDRLVADRQTDTRRQHIPRDQSSRSMAKRTKHAACEDCCGITDCKAWTDSERPAEFYWPKLCVSITQSPKHQPLLLYAATVCVFGLDRTAEPQSLKSTLFGYLLYYVCLLYTSPSPRD